MNYIFYLQKFKTNLHTPVDYYLETEDGFLYFNNLINKNISIKYLNERKCFCNKIVKTTFKNNFCYSCFYTLPQAGKSIFYPEESKAHLNIEDRDLEWEKDSQLKPHIVYLAISGKIKVGVTHSSNKFTRWIDQGADFAMVLAEMPNRYLAGKLEKEIKKYIPDKTNWKLMLKNSNNIPKGYITEIKKYLSQLIPKDLKCFILNNQNIEEIIYPHKNILEKVISLSFEKENQIDGKLTGIKGQYLIIDNEKVFNIRNHEGCKISLFFN